MSSDSNPIVRLARSFGPGWTKTAANTMLGHTVKLQRLEAGLTQQALARGTHVSVSTINRLETAETTPVRRTVESVIDYLKFDTAARAAMMPMLERALEPEWFHHRFDDCTPGYLHRLFGLESMAIEIITYDVRLVPGVLQTPAYIDHIVRSGLHLAEWESEERDLRRAQRLERQERVLGQSSPPQCIFMMDDSVLRRKVGHKTVMRDQMIHLRKMADLPHITIRFVHSGRMIAGNEAAMAGSMAQLKFGRGGLPDFVYVEQYLSATYHGKPDRDPKKPGKALTRKQSNYERHLQLLLRVMGEGCASPAKSRQMLDRAIKRWS